MKIIALIPARGGSKGVPRKNIRMLVGKPLIAYSIEVAKKCKLIDRVIVSTDDDYIGAVAKKYGAEVPFKRPRNLATDTSPMFPVTKHAINFLITHRCPVDIVVQLDPTSPLRSVGDIEGCIKTLINNRNIDMVTTMYEAHNNPYFNMMEYNKEGYLEVSKKTKEPIYRRQDAPKVYQLNASIYAFWADRVLKAGTYWSGKVKGYLMPEERSIMIDHEIEFKLAELIVKKNI